jgi:SM-20-related protein
MTINLLEIPDFLDAEAVHAVREEVRSASGGPATVLSDRPEGRVAPGVRKTTRVAVSTETRERIEGLLRERMPEIAAHFGRPLANVEAPQFLRYDEGDYFVAHQDGNTPMIHDESRFRKVSAVIFLSPHADEPEPGTYGGGALVFHGPYTGPMLRVPVTPAPGHPRRLRIRDHARGDAGDPRRALHHRGLLPLRRRRGAAQGR